MSNVGKAFAIALLVALAWAVVPIAEAQPPIRIGASLAQTGAYAAPGQNQLRGYRLCVKQLNDKGRVLGRPIELVVYKDGSDPPRPSVSMTACYPAFSRRSRSMIRTRIKADTGHRGHRPQP